METPSVPTAIPPVTIVRQRSSSLVLISGLATTVLALFGVWLLHTVASFNIMGYYLNKFIPIGAIGVGLLASSGYGLASWKTGIKMTRALLWTVMALLVFAYFAAQYIDYLSLGRLENRWTGERIGFLQYFDIMTRAFAWKPKLGQAAEPIGLWGYAIRALDIIGFALGGLIVPAGLKSQEYCETCQLYKHTRPLGYVPASIPLKKIPKKETEARAAHEAEQQKAIDAGHIAHAALQKLAEDNQAAEFAAELDKLAARQKETLKLPAFIIERLTFCKRCHDGRLVSVFQIGTGNNVRSTPLGTTPLKPDLVATLSARD